MPDSEITRTRNGNVVARLHFTDYEGRCSIESIFVDPDYRRQGIATSMCEELRRRRPDSQLVAPLVNKPGRALLNALDYLLPEGQEQ